MERVASPMVLSGGCQHPCLLLLYLQGFPSLRGVMAEAASLLPMGGLSGNKSIGWDLVSKGCISLKRRCLKEKEQNTVLKVHFPDLSLPPSKLQCLHSVKQFSIW